jgi:hypothetical protein
MARIQLTRGGRLGYAHTGSVAGYSHPVYRHLIVRRTAVEPVEGPADPTDHANALILRSGRDLRVRDGAPLIDEDNVRSVSPTSNRQTVVTFSSAPVWR